MPRVWATIVARARVPACATIVATGPWEYTCPFGGGLQSVRRVCWVPVRVSVGVSCPLRA